MVLMTLHAALLLLRLLFLSLLGSVHLIVPQLGTPHLFAVLYPHLHMTGLVTRTHAGLPAGIVVRAVSCLTGTIPTVMVIKEGLRSVTGIATAISIVIEREIMTEKETRTEIEGVTMIEIEIMSIEDVIMIERKIMTGTKIEGVIMTEEAAREGVGPEVGAGAGVGVGASKLVVNGMITIQALVEMTAKKKKTGEHLCQAIWPS